MTLKTPRQDTSELRKYDIIVITYAYVVREHRPEKQYLDAVRGTDDQRSDQSPERPILTLLLQDEGCLPLGESLILDDAHILTNPCTNLFVDNPNTRRLKALQRLRSRLPTCIMLPATPLVEPVVDSYVYLSFLKGHPITSEAFMLKAFSTWTKGQSKVCPKQKPHHTKVASAHAACHHPSALAATVPGRFV